MELLSTYSAPIPLSVFLDVTSSHIIAASQRYGLTVLAPDGSFQRLIQTQGLVMQRACRDSIYAVASTEGIVPVFDLNSGAKTHEFKTEAEYVSSVSLFTTNRSILAAACSDGTIHVWNLDIGSEFFSIQSHEEYTGFVEIHDSLIFSSGGDGKVKVWDLENGKLELVLEGHRGGVIQFAFWDEKGFLATGDVRGEVRVWDLKERTCLALLPAHTTSLDEHFNKVTSLIFTPNHLVSTGADGKLCFWKTSDWTLSHMLTVHSALCSGAIWTGETIVTSGLDGKIKVWDPEMEDGTDGPVFEMNLKGVVRMVKNGRRLVTLASPSSKPGKLGGEFWVQMWDLDVLMR